jgi:hypothetical protein
VNGCLHSTMATNISDLVTTLQLPHTWTDKEHSPLATCAG